MSRDSIQKKQSWTKYYYYHSTIHEEVIVETTTKKWAQKEWNHWELVNSSMMRQSNMVYVWVTTKVQELSWNEKKDQSLQDECQKN